MWFLIKFWKFQWIFEGFNKTLQVLMEVWSSKWKLKGSTRVQKFHFTLWIFDRSLEVLLEVRWMVGSFNKSFKISTKVQKFCWKFEGLNGNLNALIKIEKFH